MDNIELARRAWGHADKISTDRQIGDYNPLLEAVSEDVVFKYAIQDGTPISGEFRGKRALSDFFTSTVTEVAEDGHVNGPVQFIGDGDRVVMLGTESYKIKKDGDIVASVSGREFAIVMDFQHGLITRILEIKDLSEFIEVYLTGDTGL